MIQAALDDEQAEITFRRYMQPFVEEVVDKYIAEHHLEALPRQELVSAGWTHFGMALKHYRQKAVRMVGRDNWQQIETAGERLTLSKGESRQLSLRLATLRR